MLYKAGAVWSHSLDMVCLERSSDAFDGVVRGGEPACLPAVRVVVVYRALPVHGRCKLRLHAQTRSRSKHCVAIFQLR